MKTILKSNITLIFSIFFLFIVNVNAQEYGQWEVLNEGGNFTVIKFINDQVGWIAGEGTLLKTEDGGDTWELLPMGSLWNISTIDFVNETVGWIGGEETLLKTEDGGKTWSVHHPLNVFFSTINVSIKMNINIMMLSPINDTLVYAFGYRDEHYSDPKILKTVNGGNTWIDISQELTEYHINSVMFFNSNTGIVECTESWEVGGTLYSRKLIFRTVNGGNTWIDISQKLTEYHINSVMFFNSDSGIVKGTEIWEVGSVDHERHIIFRTVDGGNTWDEITTEFVEISNFQFVNDSLVYFFARDDESDIHYLCATTDALNSWTIKLQSFETIICFYCVDDKKLYAVVHDEPNSIMRSSDGGLTWEKTIFGASGINIGDIYVSKTGVVFILGEIYSNSISYKSIDNGNNLRIWRLSYPFLDVCFIDKNTGFAAGGGGLGPHHVPMGDMWFTIDGGMTWQHNFATGMLNSCYFINDLVGFALAIGWRNFTIYKTNNLGTNWINVYENNPDSTGYTFRGSDISFINEDVGWAVGRSSWAEDSSGAGILESVDGGENWDLVWKYPNTDVYEYSLNSIHAVETTAWAVGENGMILKYMEQNQWQDMPSITDLPLNDVFFSDENHGWIAGGYFNEDNVYLKLFRTKNGGENWQQMTDIDYQINDMFFEDSLHGWAVGNDTSYNGNWKEPSDCGIILETTDGGDNWVPQKEDLSAPLNALHFKDGYGWAVGRNGLVLRTEDGASWIDETNGKSYPNKFSLSQNYPNPFNPSTTIEFSLPKSEFVELKVFNILGKEVTTLVYDKLQAGNRTYTFDGKNLASGVYYYRLVAGDYRDVKKMILLR